MSASFMLDTNAYFHLFNPSKPPEYRRLVSKLTSGSVISFCIPEIVSMEIHSVIGKHARGSQAQRGKCERIIRTDKGETTCSNTWISHRVKKLPTKIVRDIRKMIKDIENQRGHIQANIVSLESAAIKQGRELLLKHGDTHNFASHDALIIGSFLVAKQNMETELVLVSSDKGLKAVCVKEGVPVYDPRIIS